MDFEFGARRIGRTIREIRLVRGLTQEGLADRTGLHLNSIGSIERGERNVTLRQLLVLADALDVAPMEFWRDT